MQLLKSLHIILKSTVMKCLALQAVLILFLVCSGGAGTSFAIGKWRQGEVSSPPWRSNYTYITINHGQETRYVIMKGAKMVSVYNKNGAEHQEPLALSSIHRGDTLAFMVEGNRIYQIKKIRK